LGLFLTLALGHLSVGVMTPVAVGVIGGFTTFSTFMWEGFTFSRTGRVGVALVYLSVSVIGGLIAVWGGHALARSIRGWPLLRSSGGGVPAMIHAGITAFSVD
jgi:fluoride ion exporter CrcB/FEX